MTRHLAASLTLALVLTWAAAAHASSPARAPATTRIKRALMMKVARQLVRKNTVSPERRDSVAVTLRERAEHGRWVEIAARHDPSLARSPFRFKLSQFKGRGGVRRGRVDGEAARVRWVDGEVALVATASGPEIFLGTADLDPDVARLVRPGARIVVEVERHPAGGVMAVNPRAP